jgi:alkylhydroperoxidase family enzyme
MTSASRIAPGDRRQVGRLNHAVATALGRLHGTTPPNLFLTLGRHRRLFRAWLVILRVAHRRGCVYELDHHRRLGVRAGLAPADIDELAEPDAPAHPRWSAREAALLAAVDQLLDDRDVDDATWAELARHLDERRLVELVLLVGHYDMLATTIATLRIQPDPPRRGRTGR